MATATAIQKLDTFVLYTWKEEVGLLYTAEQGSGFS